MKRPCLGDFRSTEGSRKSARPPRRMPAAQLLHRCFLLLSMLLLAGCQTKRAPIHHVLIAYPERWNDGDRRPCFLGPAGGSTVSPAFSPPPDLPQLDCDRFVQGEVIHRTPPERVFALDVSFEGDYSAALSRKVGTAGDSLWTCQKIGDGITCKP